MQLMNFLIKMLELQKIEVFFLKIFENLNLFEILLFYILIDLFREAKSAFCYIFRKIKAFRLFLCVLGIFIVKYMEVIQLFRKQPHSHIVRDIDFCFVF